MTFHPFLGQRSPAPAPKQSLSEKLGDTMRAMTRKSVLFVNDDESLQVLMNTVQSDLQVDVTATTNGTGARNLISNKKFDLAILDVGILNGDGLDLYRWIKDNFPRLSVIFITGGSMDEICPKVHAIGSAPVYFKPTVGSLHFLTDLLRYAGAKPI